MPKRTQVERFPSPKVQGKDSWVEFRHFAWGEVRRLQGEIKGKSIDDMNKDPEAAENASAIIEGMIVDHLVAWNWVDDDGKELPVPKTREDLANMMDNEIAFLIKTVVGMTNGMDPNGPERKN